MNIVGYWANMASISKRALKIAGQSSLISMKQNKEKMWYKCLRAWFRVQASKKGEHRHFHGRSQKQGTPSGLDKCSHWHSMKRGSHEHTCMCGGVGGLGSSIWSTPKQQDKSHNRNGSFHPVTTNSLKNLLEAWCRTDSGREVMTSLLFGHLCFYLSGKNYEVPLPIWRHSGMWGSGLKPRAFSHTALGSNPRLNTHWPHDPGQVT